MEYVIKKKEKSRVDVCMEHLKQVSNKEIYDIDDKDVVEFLIFKDVNDSGRTVVHKDTCPYVGTTSLEHCADKIQCGFRHQAESMRVGIVDHIVPLIKWETLQDLFWLENISPLSDKNRESQELYLEGPGIWKDLKWTDLWKI